ncbi:MAG: hypothetical protein JRF42_12950, partial [Deltaproteobacteria bacterium]|nr:hypothetical protein [Deltaproteobacteria bacterium]
EIDLVSQDPREEPFTPQELQAAIEESGGFPTLHIAETFIAIPDLVRIVEQQVQSREN